MSRPGAVRLTAVGHPDVTARHAKTLELTGEPGITARASCVLGVRAGPLPGELGRLRGRVRLTLAAGEETASVEGEVNPRYASAERLVVRRSDRLDPDTLLVNATAGAADLDRALVDRLRDPATRLHVTVCEVGDPDPVLLVLLPGPADLPPPVAALAGDADAVLDLTGPGAPAPPVDLPGPRRHCVPDPAELTGARTVLVLAADPSALAAGTPARAGLDRVLPRVRALVWPPAPGADLLLAAGVPPAPALHAGPLPTTAGARRDLAALIAPAPVTAVLTVAATAVDEAAVGEAIADLRERLPAHTLLLPDPAIGWGTGAVALPPGAPLEPGVLRGLRHSPALALVPPPDRAAALAVAPATLARLLRGKGLSGRTTADLLTALGLPRRDAYRLATEQTPGQADP